MCVYCSTAIRSSASIGWVRGIKGRTSRVLRQEFQVLRTRLPTLRVNSYFGSTVGGAPLGVIKQFIENQKYV
jgi:putative transposase